MKKILFSLIILFCTLNSCAQANTDSLRQADTAFAYRLFPTPNMWTFIKLDTRNGKMWQVQFSIKGNDYRFETDLNLTSLVPKEDEVNGRFTLYPTSNTYNLVLLDQYDGRTWQVQWSTEAETRKVFPISIDGFDKFN